MRKGTLASDAPGAAKVLWGHPAGVSPFSFLDCKGNNLIAGVFSDVNLPSLGHAELHVSLEGGVFLVAFDHLATIGADNHRIVRGVLLDGRFAAKAER